MIYFTVQIPRFILSEKINMLMDNVLSRETFESHGIRLSLAKRGDAFVNVDGEVVFINAISEIQVFKEGGLFSSEINGVIDLNLIVKYHISENFEFSSKTELLDFKWIEAPKLEIGSLDIPVEKLVDLALKHYESIITAKIDNGLKEAVQLKKIVSQSIETLDTLLQEKVFHDTRLYFSIASILLGEVTNENDLITAHGGVVLDSMIGQENHLPQKKLLFERIEKLSDDNILFTNFSLSESVILPLIQKGLLGQTIGGKPLTLANEKLEIDVESIKLTGSILSPIEGKLAFYGSLRYNEHLKELHIDNIDFNLEPDGLLYKLTAPLVNTFVEQKIKEIFPLKINDLFMAKLNEILSNVLINEEISITPKLSYISVDKLQCENSHITGLIRIDKPTFEITLV